MEERKLTGPREHMDKVANLVATAMGVARLLDKPKVREEYLGGGDLPLLLMGEALERAAHDAEDAIEWEYESLGSGGRRPRTP